MPSLMLRLEEFVTVLQCTAIRLPVSSSHDQLVSKMLHVFTACEQLQGGHFLT